MIIIELIVILWQYCYDDDYEDYDDDQGDGGDKKKVNDILKSKKWVMSHLKLWNRGMRITLKCREIQWKSRCLRDIKYWFFEYINILTLTNIQSPTFVPS